MANADMKSRAQALLDEQGLYIQHYRENEFDIYTKEGILVCPDFETEEAAITWIERQVIDGLVEPA